MVGMFWIWGMAVTLLTTIDIGKTIVLLDKLERKQQQVHITDNDEFSGIIENNAFKENCMNIPEQSYIIVFKMGEMGMLHKGEKIGYRELGFWLKNRNGKVLDIRRKVDLSFNFTLQGMTSPSVWKISDVCKNAGPGDCGNRFKYRLSVENGRCVRCGNTFVKPPQLDINGQFDEDITSLVDDKGGVDPAVASKVMLQLSSVVEKMNFTAGSISLGTAKGVMVKPKDEYDLGKLSFISSDGDLNVIEDEEEIQKYGMFVSISEEAYRNSYAQTKNKTFVGVFRFPNMTVGENVSILSDDVFAIEMGSNISNLSEPIQISLGVEIPRGFNVSCQSWDGRDLANWTTEGCVTSITDRVTCECSHLTFFAVLMTGTGEGISSSDLLSLTYITYIGCSLSVFFLGIALFMFFCVRKAKASNAIHILIHLFMALFLLNVTFMSNESLAGLGNKVACEIFAALMHYSMLCTFTWFAIEAFHLALQLTKYATILIPHYKLKLSLIGWIPAAVVVIIIFSLGKYGELKIRKDNGNDAKMCWILDMSVQYVVNIGYYATTFLFTFTIFIVMLRWIWLLQRSKVKPDSGFKSSKDIITIMGLCFLLGITWSFAFFSHGPLLLPSYYVFTILNSFQGFFLFLYYCNTNSLVGDNSSTSISTSTRTTKTDMRNPYDNDKSS